MAKLPGEALPVDSDYYPAVRQQAIVSLKVLHILKAALCHARMPDNAGWTPFLQTPSFAENVRTVMCMRLQRFTTALDPYSPDVALSPGPRAYWRPSRDPNVSNVGLASDSPWTTPDVPSAISSNYVL